MYGLLIWCNSVHQRHVVQPAKRNQSCSKNFPVWSMFDACWRRNCCICCALRQIMFQMTVWLTTCELTYDMCRWQRGWRCSNRSWRLLPCASASCCRRKRRTLPPGSLMLSASSNCSRHDCCSGPCLIHAGLQQVKRMTRVVAHVLILQTKPVVSS